MFWNWVDLGEGGGEEKDSGATAQGGARGYVLLARIRDEGQKAWRTGGGTKGEVRRYRYNRGCAAWYWHCFVGGAVLHKHSARFQ